MKLTESDSDSSSVISTDSLASTVLHIEANSSDTGTEVQGTDTKIQLSQLACAANTFCRFSACISFAPLKEEKCHVALVFNVFQHCTFFKAILCQN